MDELFNQVMKIIYDKNYIVFVMKLTSDDNSFEDFFWWWAVEKKYVEKYFNYPVENLSIQAANIYCNDEANADEGFSCASYDTVEEAEKDYFENGGGI